MRLIIAPDKKPPSPHLHPLRGYFFIAAAAFLWGISAALGRAVFTGKLLLSNATLHPIDPLVLSQTRTTFSLLVLLPLLVGLKGWQRIKLPARDLAYCLLLGIFGVAVSNYFYYVAIQRTNVATAIIVQYTAPVWVLIYVVARGQQRLTAQKVAAVALAVTGIALVINLLGSKGAALRLDSYGMIAALLASFSFAFYNVAGHHLLARYDRWRVLVWTFAAAAAFWLIVNPPWKIAAARYAPAQWLFLFGFSMISVLGPFSLYFRGLQHLEPTRAIIASCLEPVFHPSRRPAVRRSAAPDPDFGNYLCARRHPDRPAPRSQRCRRIDRGRAHRVVFPNGPGITISEGAGIPWSETPHSTHHISAPRASAACPKGALSIGHAREQLVFSPLVPQLAV